MVYDFLLIVKICHLNLINLINASASYSTNLKGSERKLRYWGCKKVKSSEAVRVHTKARDYQTKIWLSKIKCGQSEMRELWEISK